MSRDRHLDPMSRYPWFLAGQPAAPALAAGRLMISSFLPVLGQALRS